MILEDNSPFCTFYPKGNATTEDSCMEQNDANCSWNISEITFTVSKEFKQVNNHFNKAEVNTVNKDKTSYRGKY